MSIFGGIVVLNREVDAATAEKMHGVFLEIIKIGRASCRERVYGLV